MSTSSVFNSLALPIEYNRSAFLDLTNKLNNYNEIYNMNSYVGSVNNNEYQNISALDSSLKTKLYKLKQEYFLLDFSNHNITFWTNVLYFSMCMICMTLIAIALFNSKYIAEHATISGKKEMLFYITISIISVLYLLVIMVALAKKVMRRKYSWDQFYYQKNISE